MNGITDSVARVDAAFLYILGISLVLLVLTLGIVFAGAGAALTATIGVWMIGMVVLGIVYMGIGIWMKRNDHDGRSSTRRPRAFGTMTDLQRWTE